MTLSKEHELYCRCGYQGEQWTDVGLLCRLCYEEYRELGGDTEV